MDDHFAQSLRKAIREGMRASSKREYRITPEDEEWMQAVSQRRRFAEEEDEDVGELQVAEYLIFLLALDTYVRYVEEVTSVEDPTDDVIVRGIRLLRGLDSHLDEIQKFLDGNLPSTTHKRMLVKYLQVRVADSGGVGRRALGLRTLMTRGGTATMRAIFESNKALRQIKQAVAASMMDDADAALDQFAAIQVPNARVRAWIELAARTAGATYVATSAVQAGVAESADTASKMMVQQVEEMAATGADAVRSAQEAQTDKIAEVELAATAAAKRNLEHKGEPDLPMTKSEVIGVAVAAATAIATDPSNPSNVPETLKGLDDEQKAAALTDGRVLVAAGAGAGKSSTLVARIAYLIKDRGVSPTQILATTFNAKASHELKERLGRQIGGDALNQMSAGTMHSLFRKFIGDYGTPDEKFALTKGFVEGGSTVARTVQRLWEECFEDREVPSLKKVLQYKTKWSGNNISPVEAKKLAVSDDEVTAALWYEMYEGLKGATPGWKPPCEAKASEAAEDEYLDKLRMWKSRGGRGPAPQRRGTTFETFMAKTRPEGGRLADFDDMLTIFHGILSREPAVRKAIQRMYSHILVDECQDLNTTQFEIIQMITEHISDGSDGKSLWLVGDDKQAIYSFRGAKPELFTGLDGNEAWKTRMIKTNYRCEPEFVDAANKLIANNTKQIPMMAVPSPHRVRGTGSLRVEKAGDEAEAALLVIDKVKNDSLVYDEKDRPTFFGTNAVLTRTNKELHAYETACILRGVPYARKGVSSFFGSPETTTLLGYAQLVTGDDNLKMQKALAQVINKPNRFFIAPKAGQEAVEKAIRDYAQSSGRRINEVNPVQALRDWGFQRSLAAALSKSTSGFKFDKTVEKLQEIAGSLGEMQANTTDPNYKTTDLFNAILGMTGTASAVDPGTGRTIFVEQTLRESLKVDLRDSTKDDDDADDVNEGPLGGNIAFLYALANPDPTDPGDMENDPSTPAGFKAKMERYADKMRDLRVDLTKWDKEQSALPPEQRTPPPALTLATVHATKGAQWDNTFVAMPKGKFPIVVPAKPGEPEPSPEDMARHMEDERRLAYVALTRAKKNMMVLCPDAVDGKAAGVSPFVGEAGLLPGENIPKPGSEAEALKEVSEMVKTANQDEFVGPVPDEFDTIVGEDVVWPGGDQ